MSTLTSIRWLKEVNQFLFLGQRPDDVRTVAVGQISELALALCVKNSL